MYEDFWGLFRFLKSYFPELTPHQRIIVLAWWILYGDMSPTYLQQEERY